MAQVDGAAGEPDAGGVDLGDAAGADEDPTALHGDDEAEDARRLRPGRRAEDDVGDASDGGTVGVEQREAHQPGRVDRRPGHVPDPTDRVGR